MRKGKKAVSFASIEWKGNNSTDYDGKHHLVPKKLMVESNPNEGELVTVKWYGKLWKGVFRGTSSSGKKEKIKPRRKSEVKKTLKSPKKMHKHSKAEKKNPKGRRMVLKVSPRKNLTEPITSTNKKVPKRSKTEEKKTKRRPMFQTVSPGKNLTEPSTSSFKTENEESPNSITRLFKGLSVPAQPSKSPQTSPISKDDSDCYLTCTPTPPSSSKVSPRQSNKLSLTTCSRSSSKLWKRKVQLFKNQRVSKYPKAEQKNPKGMTMFQTVSPEKKNLIEPSTSTPKTVSPGKNLIDPSISTPKTVSLEKNLIDPSTLTPKTVSPGKNLIDPSTSTPKNAPRSMQAVTKTEVHADMWQPWIQSSTDFAFQSESEESPNSVTRLFKGLRVPAQSAKSPQTSPMSKDDSDCYLTSTPTPPSSSKVSPRQSNKLSPTTCSRSSPRLWKRKVQLFQNQEGKNEEPNRTKSDGKESHMINRTPQELAFMVLKEKNWAAYLPKGCAARKLSRRLLDSVFTAEELQTIKFRPNASPTWDKLKFIKETVLSTIGKGMSQMETDYLWKDCRESMAQRVKYRRNKAKTANEESTMGQLNQSDIEKQESTVGQLNQSDTEKQESTLGQLNRSDIEKQESTMGQLNRSDIEKPTIKLEQKYIKSEQQMEQISHIEYSDFSSYDYQTL